jgi:CheY-like chemotaxis protein
MIVEDDADDITIMQELMDQLQVKHPLIFFETGDAAFNYLMSTEQKPFLIICDVNIPKLNGIEFKQKIDRTDYLRAKSIPFVFFSTADNETAVNTAYRKTNMQGYFRKSMNVSEMKQQLETILAYWSIALQPTAK